MSVEELHPRINQWLYEESPFSFFLGKLEEKIQAKRTTLFYVLLMIFVLILINKTAFSLYTCIFLCTGYPILGTVGSMESGNHLETGSWLLYWVLMVASLPFLLLPLPYLFYSAFAFWLWFPVTKGVQYIYVHFLRPFAQIQHGNIDPEIWKDLHPVFLKMLDIPNADAKLLQTVDPNLLQKLKSEPERPAQPGSSTPTSGNEMIDVNVINALMHLSNEEAAAFINRLAGALPALKSLAELQRKEMGEETKTTGKQRPR